MFVVLLETAVSALPRCLTVFIQWRRQCSKGARSFRGQKIIQPGHPDALFFLKKVDDLFLVVALETQAANAISPSK